MRRLVPALVLCIGCTNGAAPPPSVIAPAATAAAGPAPAPHAPEAARHDAKFGDAIGDAFGPGGLGLSGVGEGAGGRGEGICLCGDPPPPTTAPRVGGARDAPVLRQRQVKVEGRLPPEVVQRIVRENFGRFRLCYEKGLEKTPNLAGTIATTFVIGRSGAVSSAKLGSSDLASPDVQSCVVHAFENLSFPQPESGEVRVTFPIDFRPSD